LAGAAEDPPIAFFIRWNMLGLAGAAAGAVLVVVVLATVVELLHCALLAFPALVQSYVRVVVVLVAAATFGAALAAGGFAVAAGLAAAPLQAALLALPGFEQS
jgi:hypothetical protein